MKNSIAPVNKGVSRQGFAYSVMCKPRDVKMMIVHNVTRNNPIKAKDVNIALGMIGKDLGFLKGFAARSGPNQVIDNQVPTSKLLLKPNKNLEACIDAAWISGLPFL